MKKQLNLKEKILLFIKQHRKKTTIHTVIALVVSILAIVLVSKLGSPDTVKSVRDNEAVFVATFAGDMLLDGNVERVIKEQGSDHLFKYVGPYFNISDYATGYMDFYDEELDGKNRSNSKEIDIVTTLKNMKFSVVNLPSHYDLNTIKSAVSVFDSAGIDCVGTDISSENEYNISYRLVKGVKVASLGIVDIYRDDKRRKKLLPESYYKPVIQEAKRNADLVIVHINWGEEYISKVSTRQKKIAKALSKAGADIIIGHNSHMIQPIEIIGDTLVFYGVGNLFFDQIWESTKESALVQYKVSNDGNKRIEVTPLYSRAGQPRPLTGVLKWFQRQKIFQKLTKDLTDDVTWKIENERLIINLKN